MDCPLGLRRGLFCTLQRSGSVTQVKIQGKRRGDAAALIYGVVKYTPGPCLCRLPCPVSAAPVDWLGNQACKRVREVRAPMLPTSSPSDFQSTLLLVYSNQISTTITVCVARNQFIFAKGNGRSCHNVGACLRLPWQQLAPPN